MVLCIYVIKRERDELPKIYFSRANGFVVAHVDWKGEAEGC